MTTTKETDYAAEAASDAHDMAENFAEEMVTMWGDTRTISTDLNNDYHSGHRYHHETHTDRSYSLTEAAAVLDQLSRYEEDDSGLWEGLSPREAISAQAAYTYAAAVYAEWQTIVEDLQSELEDLAEAVEANPPTCFYAEVKNETDGGWERLPISDEFETREDAEAEVFEDEHTRIAEGAPEDYDADEAVATAGARFIRLHFELHGLADEDFGGMVRAARRAAEVGEFTAALGLADAIQERGEKYDESKAQRIRDAVK